MTVVVLLSGGLDSALCLDLAVEKHGKDSVVALTVDYEQPHSNEVEYAKRLAEKAGVEHRIVTVRGLYKEGSGGFFNADSDLSIAAETVVPFRNIVLLACAAVHGDEVWLGANQDDREDYEDCRPSYFDKAFRLLRVGINTPLFYHRKTDVIEEAKNRGIRLEDTMSCYRGTNCGECAACLLRGAG